MCMSNITLYLPAEVKQSLDTHPEIRWSEVVRQAVINKLKELRKLEILRKYVEHEPFTSEDLEWMDENDWHPVDEKEMKLSFVRETGKARKGKFVKGKSADALFE